MIKRNNKKGFTIVELVIVIAVIAILAAVLIPTFAGIIKKANLSADQQAVRQMNTALAVDGAVTPTSIFELHDVLSEMGMTSEDYHPLTKDTYFFWDAAKNCILHVDEDMKIIVPADRAGEAYVAGTSKWISLTLSIEATKPDGFEKDDDTVTVKNGAELLYIIDAVADKKAYDGLTIKVPTAGIDMMGASFDIPVLSTDLTIVSEDANKPATIYNATAVEAAYMGLGKTQSDMGQYNTSLFPKVDYGATLTINNVVFENINMKNTHSSNVGIIAGSVYGSVEIDNVTIKNSTIIGHRNVGALIGNVQSTATATIGTVTMENVSVKTVGGRSGMLVGVMGATNGAYGTLTSTGSITLKNCSVEVYECEQNAGAAYGLKAGVLYSWVIESNGSKKDRDYTFDAKALVMKDDGDNGVTANDLFGGTVSGWN